MAFEALSSIPCEFESGNSVTITMPLPNVAPSEGAATLYLSLNGTAVANYAATESGNDFTFTISAVASAALAPGLYDYAIYFTYTAGERVSVGTGQVAVLPNLATSQTPSFAQAQVTLLETALATLNATANASVSFNGQSYTRVSMNSLREQWTFWKSRVLQEQAAANARRGVNPQRNYAPSFGGGTSWPYCGCP